MKEKKCLFRKGSVLNIDTVLVLGNGRRIALDPGGGIKADRVDGGGSEASAEGRHE